MHLLRSCVPSLVLLAVCCLTPACDGKHQYLVVPRSEARGFVAGLEARTWVDLAPGSATVLDGALALSVGKGARIRVDFGTAATFAVSQLVLWVKEPGTGMAGTLELELTGASAAAGSAELQLSVTDEKPDREACGGTDTCYLEADEGVTSLTAIPANPTTAGMPGTRIAATVPALSSGSSTCGGFTAAKCCAGQSGISAVSCNVDKACGCPSGTTSAGEKADGTVTCLCP